VIGAGIGALTLASRPPDPLLVIWLAVFALLLPYGQSRNYGLYTVFFAPLVVLLIDLLSNDGWHLAETRLIDTLLGCGIALFLGYVPWPSSWHRSWTPDFAATVDCYLEQALGENAPCSSAQPCDALMAEDRIGHCAVSWSLTRTAAPSKRPALRSCSACCACDIGYTWVVALTL
jgi:hypothetical protein